MTRAIVAALFLASLQIAAPAPTDAASPLCSVGTAGIVPLQDGKTYALALTSPSETPLSVSFDVHSARSDYGTPPTTVAFRPIAPAETKALQTSAHFISQPILVSLPKFDTILVARASVAAGAQPEPEACTPRAVLTTFYLRRQHEDYQPPAAWVDWHQHVIDTLPPDAPVVKASEIPFTGAKCDSPNARARMTSFLKPIYPKIALLEHDSGVTVVDIRVDESGSFAGATVVSSAGNPAIDAAVVDTAHVATYSPARYHCLAVPGVVHHETIFADRPNTHLYPQ